MGKLKTAYKNIKIAIKERVKEKAEERVTIKSANKDIRKKAIQAGIEEKEKQSIRFAKEKQKVFADKKIEALKQPSQPLFNPQPSHSQQNKSPQESFGDLIMRM